MGPCVARILKNEEGLPTKKVRRRLVQLLVRTTPGGDDDGRALGEGGVEAIPEGDPELLAGLVSALRRGGPADDEQRPEHTFGSHRYHERRSSGRAGLAGSGRDGLVR